MTTETKDTKTLEKVFLSRSKIMEVSDLVRLEVEVPEWGGWICLQEMTAKDRDEWEQLMYKADGVVSNMRADFVARCAVDPKTGKRLFTTGEVETLGGKSARVLANLFARAREVCKMSDGTEESASKNS